MRFEISGVVEGGTHLGTIEADDVERAIERAIDELDLGVSFCHHCARRCEDPEITRLIVTDETGAAFEEDL